MLSLSRRSGGMKYSTMSTSQTYLLLALSMRFIVHCIELV